MSDLAGVNIGKGKVGANVNDEGDAISGLVIAAPASANLAHGDVSTIYNLVDAEKLGITPKFDKDNNVHVYRHVREYFRLNGSGIALYLMLTPQATTMVNIVTDTNANLAKKLLIAAEGKVRQIAIAVNPTGATTHLNGLPDDVFNAIAFAQGLANWAEEQFMPVQILLEGYDYAGNASSVQDLHAITNVKAPDVSIVVGQDWRYAEAKTGNAQRFADVGTALGTVSAAAVNQNIGENERFNLTDATRDAWLVAGLSSHQKNNDVYADLQTLEDKGYIFGITYVGIDGVRWNNDHTCTEVVVDAEGNINEHTIAYGRTHKKIRRNLRAALLPKVKTRQPVDSKTGKLPAGVVKYFENIGDAVLLDMQGRNEISEGKTTVDPNSDLLIEKILKMKFRAVPYGNIGFIDGVSNLKTSL